MEVDKEKISSWVNEELNGIDIGDTRLNDRAKIMLETLGSKPNVSIPNAFCNGWSELKAAYRFFDNGKVTAEKILLPHTKATIKRIQQEKVVLIPQDTTQFHFYDKNLEGIGPLSYENEAGFLSHISMAVTPEGVNLGIISNRTWARNELGKTADRKKKRIEEKESYRWLESLLIANEVAKKAPKTTIVSVSDREGDIYELYAELDKLETDNLHYLVRVSIDRKLEDEAANGNTIWSNIVQADNLGEIEVNIPRSGSRKSRQAVLTLRASQVRLCPPKRDNGEQLLPVEMSIILAQEESPPKGSEPIQWLLLTDIEVTTFEEAVEKLSWYICRWQIEIYFRILKTGCKIEELQLEHFDRIKVCLSLYMIIAWRIQMLIKFGKEVPEMPCDVLFDGDEWKAAYIIKFKQVPPKQVPTLGEMCRVVASFGGFIGRKSDGFPGAETLWLGLQRVRDFKIALAAAKAMVGTYG
ncbi:MAG: IS4 family transposase [Bacteroidota bacterium]